MLILSQDLLQEGKFSAAHDYACYREVIEYLDCQKTFLWMARLVQHMSIHAGMTVYTKP